MPIEFWLNKICHNIYQKYMKFYSWETLWCHYIEPIYSLFTSNPTYVLSYLSNIWKTLLYILTHSLRVRIDVTFLKFLSVGGFTDSGYTIFCTFSSSTFSCLPLSFKAISKQWYHPTYAFIPTLLFYWFYWLCLDLICLVLS